MEWRLVKPFCSVEVLLLKYLSTILPHPSLSLFRLPCMVIALLPSLSPSVKEEGEIMWEQSLYLEDTLLARVFMGQLLSSLYCTSCGHTSRTFDPIWDVALPFPDVSVGGYILM